MYAHTIMLVYLSAIYAHIASASFNLHVSFVNIAAQAVFPANPAGSPHKCEQLVQGTQGSCTATRSTTCKSTKQFVTNRLITVSLCIGYTNLTNNTTLVRPSLCGGKKLGWPTRKLIAYTVFVGAAN